MPAPGRNDPCPCGSGKKFKKCCLPTSEPGAPFEEERDDDSLYRSLHDDEYLAGRRSLDSGIEEVARDLMSEDDSLRGHDADSFLVFAEPLLAHAGSDREGLKTALLAVNMLWWLSLLSQVGRRAALKDVIPKFAAIADLEVDKFRYIALRMTKRHEVLFPHLHKPSDKETEK